MKNIVIGIPTYKRPDLLQKLIRSIFILDLDVAFIKHVDIVVVDNDVNKTAQSSIVELVDEVPSQFSLNYFNNASKGLSHVRNEILKQSKVFQPDYLAFVDDDEYVTKNWLNELMKTMTQMNADIVLGPNIPVFEKEIPEFLSHWFIGHNFDNNTKVKHVATNNLLLSSKFLMENNLSFDSRFNQTGGEDTFFGEQALQNGAIIFWSKDAIVYEIIPKKRGTLKWLMLRIYRSTSTYTYILKIQKSYKRIIKKFIISLLYLVVGIFGLLLLPFSMKYKFWGLFKLCEAFGGFAGMFSIRYKEYANIN